MSIVPCCSGSMLTLPVSDHTSPPELTAAVAAGSGVRLYVILLGAQCAGDLGILLHGIPIYRRFLTGVVDQRADLSTFAWAAASVVVIQVTYWWSTLKVFPTLSIRPRLIFGRVVLFSARLNFVFTTGLFATIFFVRFAEIEFSWWRALMLLAVLFSMFCFTLELERLGQVLMGRTSPASNLSR